MLKPFLLALAGLATAVPAASANTIIQVDPRLGPAVEILPGEAADLRPSVDLCLRFGIACSVPAPTQDFATLLDLVPLAQADAAKRWALYAEEWAELADLYDRPVPRPPVHGLYGWGDNRLAEIEDLLEDLEDRLTHRPAPLHGLLGQHPRLQVPYGLNPRLYSFGHPRPQILRPQGAWTSPGNSIIILPSR